MQVSLADSILQDNQEFDDESPLAYNPNLSKSQIISEENYQFKPNEFFQFFIYFLINIVLGPFSILLLSFKQNGCILAKNLCIYKGLRDWKHISIYLIKVFCIVTTFTLSYQEASSLTVIVQLYVVIYTEISLAVLLAAYYSSFTMSEIERIKNDPNFVVTDENIVDKLLEVSRTAKEKAFSKRHININFPEIDLDRFNLIYPLSHQPFIPHEIKYRISNDEDKITYHPLQSFIVIDGISYSQYILGRMEYGYLGFHRALKYSFYLSRILVLIRVISPIIVTIYSVLHGNAVAEKFFEAIIFIFEEIGYSYLIFRFSLVYDVLFLGILIYIQKYRILHKLDKCLREDVIEDKNSDPLKIDKMIPSNIQTWYNIRKLLSNVNQQIVTIVDINMSFIAIFLILFILIFAILAFDLLKNIGFITSLAHSFAENKQLVAITSQFILVFVIILLVSLAIGMQINLYFQSDINIMTTHLFKVKDLRIFWIYYCNNKAKLTNAKPGYKFDLYVKYMMKLKKYFGINGSIIDGDQPVDDFYSGPEILDIQDQLDEKEKNEIQDKEKIENEFDMETKEEVQKGRELGSLKDMTSEFQNEYTLLISQLQKETRNIIDKLNFDLLQNPHKILGVATKTSTFVQVASVISVVGVSSINAIIGAMKE